MPKRKRLLLFGLLTTVALIAVAPGVWLLWPHTAITRENAEKIENGMTLADVEQLLGGHARNESDMPDNFINDAFVMPYAAVYRKALGESGAHCHCTF